MRARLAKRVKIRAVLLRAELDRKEEEENLLLSCGTLHKEEKRKIKSVKLNRQMVKKGKKLDTLKEIKNMEDVVEVTQWVGAKIVLRNLKSREELNGTGGVVTGLNDTGDRYVVTTDKGRKLSVMEDKLELVDVEEVVNLIP